MELLVLNEKNSVRYFIPDEHGLFTSAFIKIIKDRVSDGSWYQDDDALTAQGLLDDYEAGEDVSTEVVSFMKRRITYTYEDWEFASTDN